MIFQLGKYQIKQLIFHIWGGTTGLVDKSCSSFSPEVSGCQVGDCTYITCVLHLLSNVVKGSNMHSIGIHISVEIQDQGQAPDPDSYSAQRIIKHYVHHYC